MLEEKTIDHIWQTALSRGGELAEVYAEHRSLLRMKLEEGAIRNSQYGLSRGAGIRVIASESVGYSCSDDLSAEKLVRAAKAASHIASQPGSRRNVANISDSIKYANMSELSPGPAPLPPDVEKIADLLYTIEAAARAYDPRIRQVNVDFYHNCGNFVVANSEGCFRRGDENVSGLIINVLAVQPGGGIKVTGIEIIGGRVDFDYYAGNEKARVIRAARTAAGEAIRKLEAIPAPSGTFPVVIGPGWGGLLVHESVGHCLEADAYRKDASIFSGMMGRKVASELVTLVDDGTIQGSRGSFQFDDEGTPARRTVLIEKGILKNVMTDRLNARLLGISPTGNGRRQDYRHYPIPRMSNTFVMPGSTPPEEIIASVKKGVYARNFAGGMSQPTTGDFTFSITDGYLIENGKITSPLQNATLMGNGLTALREVVMVGNDFQLDTMKGTCGKDGQSVPVGLGQPTIKIRELTVGGTGL